MLAKAAGCNLGPRPTGRNRRRGRSSHRSADGLPKQPVLLSREAGTARLDDMHVIILAAGIGSRLGSPLPKSLTRLADERTIIARQLDAISAVFPNAIPLVVVGFKKELIMEAAPSATFAYNPRFHETNTSKSLLHALQLTGEQAGVLWMNGDVVFDPTLLTRILPSVESDRSFVCVNNARVGDEEVKYRCGERSMVVELSKSVSDPLGEAVGINYVSGNDKQALLQQLTRCADNDYFEKGIELAIEEDGSQYLALDVADEFCIEVDFPDDLARVNSELTQSLNAAV